MDFIYIYKEQEDAAIDFHNSVFASSSAVLEGFFFFCAGGAHTPLSREV